MRLACHRQIFRQLARIGPELADEDCREESDAAVFRAVSSEFEPHPGLRAYPFLAQVSTLPTEGQLLERCWCLSPWHQLRQTLSGSAAFGLTAIGSGLQSVGPNGGQRVTAMRPTTACGRAASYAAAGVYQTRAPCLARRSAADGSESWMRRTPRTSCGRRYAAFS